MVVDDDPAVTRLLRQILFQNGYETIALAANGAEALARAAEADVILLDHQLPDVQGVDLLPQLLSRPDPPSVIVVTGQGNEAVASAALRLGAEDYLRKDADLTALLPGVLERARRGRALRAALVVAQADRLRSERLAAIGEMTVTLRHEMNNPLAAALGEVELMLDGEPIPAPVEESLRAIRTALLRIRDILKQMGDLRRGIRTEYLAGVGMIDLQAEHGSPPVAPEIGTALLWLSDPQVASITAAALVRAGFRVDEVSTVGAVRAGIANAPDALVIVGPPGPGDPDPLRTLAPPSTRRWTLVAFTHGDPETARQAGADLAIALPFDPWTLVEEILSVLRPEG